MHKRYLCFNELTPQEGNPFENEFLIDISECKSNVEIFDINEVFSDFLNLTSDLLPQSGMVYQTLIMITSTGLMYSKQ